MNTNMATTATTGNSSRGCSCSFGQAKPRALQGELVISGDWHQCLVVQELMACCSRTYGFEEFAVRKAVKEALANAFRHGNGMSPDKCIRVEYKMDDTKFHVSISDDSAYTGSSDPSRRSSTTSASFVTIASARALG